jgi:hypothetical protein
MATTDRDTIFSADTHAGGSHAQCGEHKKPFKDLKDDRQSVRRVSSGPKTMVATYSRIAPAGGTPRSPKPLRGPEALTNA